MILGAPWGLLALLAIPAVLAIHLFRRRFPPRVVSALWLFPEPVLSGAAGRRRERLRRSLSLIAELLAILAVTWWLTDPHLGTRAQGSGSVLVLDTRARMAAVAPDGTSARERAAEAVIAGLRDLGPDHRLSVIASGRTPHLLAGPEASPEAALAAIADWRADAGWHPLDPALALATDLARDAAGRRDRIVVVSDHRPETLSDGMGLIARGLPVAQSAIAGVEWRRPDPGAAPDATDILFVRLAATGDVAIERELVLVAPDGGVLGRRRVRIRPGADNQLRWPLTAVAGRDRLELRLTGPDALAWDDRCPVVRPAARRIRVALALAEPDLAFWRRAVAAVPDAEVVAGDAPAELRVVDDAEIDAEPGEWLVRMRPGSGPSLLGPFLIRAGHPLTRDLDTTGALWTGGSLEAVDAGSVLVAGGDQVLVRETRSGRGRSFDFHLDLAASGIVEHPAWPGLVANLVAARQASLPGVGRANLGPGQAVSVVVPAGRDAVWLDTDAGERQRLPADRDGRILLSVFERPGWYALALDPDAAVWRWLAVQPYDERLAATSGLVTTDRAADAPRTRAVERRRSALAHLLPVVVALAGLLLAWWSYPREQGRPSPREVAA